MSLLSATPATRYADSLRLSVAPMMDWTDGAHMLLKMKHIFHFIKVFVAPSAHPASTRQVVLAVQQC